MNVEYRAVDSWTDPETTGRRGSNGFRATTYQTQQLLIDEARRVHASDVVVEIVGPSTMLYKDGDGVRSDRESHVRHPGVVVRLIGTEHGDMRMACDTYTSWSANLRAVVLTLGALRAVDRYGAAKRGEQYTGWSALPPGTPMNAAARAEMTLDYAAAVLAGATDGLVRPADVLSDVDDARMSYRMAAKRYHPDTLGGSADVWAQVDEAWRLVEAHHSA